MVNRVLIAVVRAYQHVISPYIPPSCRYSPTCSQYAVDALQKYGPARGVYMAMKRLLRCTPFHSGGHDPVR